MFKCLRISYKHGCFFSWPLNPSSPFVKTYYILTQCCLRWWAHLFSKGNVVFSQYMSVSCFFRSEGENVFCLIDGFPLRRHLSFFPGTQDASSTLDSLWTLPHNACHPVVSLRISHLSFCRMAVTSDGNNNAWQAVVEVALIHSTVNL